MTRVVEEETNHTGLTLRFRGSEWTPDHKTRYMAFWVRTSDQEFTGETEFETTERVIELFATQLQSFYTELSSEPELVCGSGDEIYFRLRFSRFDRLGSVLMDCLIRARADRHFNSTQTYRRIELMRIDELRSFFQLISTNDEPLQIVV